MGQQESLPTSEFNSGAMTSATSQRFPAKNAMIGLVPYKPAK
eukprot:gene3238-13259_t